MEHVPSDWQRPSAQSESLVHRFWPVPPLPDPGLPLPHPATTIAIAKNSPETPRPPIAHLRPSTGVVRERGGDRGAFRQASPRKVAVLSATVGRHPSRDR